MSAGSWKKASVFLVVVMVIGFIPGFICGLAGLKGAAGIAGLGAVEGALVAVMAGRRVGLQVAVGLGIATALVALTAGMPLAVGLIFLAMGVLVGFLGAGGQWMAYSFVPLATGFVLGENPKVLDQPIADALVLGAVIMVSAAFAALVAAFILRSRPPAQLKPIPVVRARAYGIQLGVLLGIAAGAVSALDLAHTGSWVILTITITLQPYIQDGWTKTLQRIAGTLAGFTIAIAIGFFIPWPLAIYILGTVAALIAIEAMLQKRPYWQYAMALTVGIVLFEGVGHSIVDTAVSRLLATLAGAAAVLIVILLIRPASRRIAAKHGLDHY